MRRCELQYENKVDFVGIDLITTISFSKIIASRKYDISALAEHYLFIESQYCQQRSWRSMILR